MEGSQIGAYRIERQLGLGGFGVVYIGVDTRLGRRAAIKQLLPQFSNNREIVERFFNEAKAAANINHAGIVEIYEVGWHTDGSAYFAMKLLDGDSLARRLRSTGPLPIQLATTLARQISSALVAAHARGIVHRDLKPDNIILVPDDEVAIGERATVLDFGIAKLFGDNPLSQKTATGMMMGTPHYMSPEQCRGAGEVDHRTDVYALGCILFEMLTGRAPFVGEGIGEILGKHQYVEPPTLRSLRTDAPAELEAIVARTLAKTPEQRYAQMTELQAALQPFAAAGGRSREQPAQPAIAATMLLTPVDVAGPKATSVRDVVEEAARPVVQPVAAPMATERPAPAPIPIVPKPAPPTQTTPGDAEVRPTPRKLQTALFAIGGIAIVGVVIAVVLARSGKSVKPELGSVILWNKSESELVSIELSSEMKTVRLQHQRAENNELYWWGIEVSIEKRPKPTAPPSGGSAAPVELVETITRSRGFPLGDRGDRVVKAFVDARAISDLGTPNSDQLVNYKLGAAAKHDLGNKLTITFADGSTRAFVVGGTISGDRYVLDQQSGKAYVLSKDMIVGLEVGESSLHLTDLRGFDTTKIEQVEVERAGRKKVAKRVQTTGADGKQVWTWNDLDTGKANQPLARLSDNVDNLRPVEYAPALDVDAMTPVSRLAYRDATGGKLGTLALYKLHRPGVLPEGAELDPANPPKPEIEYYVVTERTRVPALVHRDPARQIEAELPTAFGDKTDTAVDPAPWKSNKITGLELALPAKIAGKVGKPVEIAIRATAPSGLAFHIRHALPMGVQVDRPSLAALVSSGQLSHFETADGKTDLYVNPLQSRQTFSARYKVIPTLAGTLHAKGSLVETGAKQFHVPPSVWTIE